MLERGRRGIAHVDHHLFEPPKGPGTHRVPQGRMGGIVPTVEPDHDGDRVVFQKPEALFDPVDVNAHWLLAQGRLSGLGRSLQAVDVGHGR